jgi:hypothetical protein
MKKLIFWSLSTPDETFPTASNALVVRHLVIHQTATDVVLGFIRWACGHPPDDDPDPIAGVTCWALSLHEAKLLRVTDIFVRAEENVRLMRIAER